MKFLSLIVVTCSLALCSPHLLAAEELVVQGPSALSCFSSILGDGRSGGGSGGGDLNEGNGNGNGSSGGDRSILSCLLAAINGGGGSGGWNGTEQ